MIMIQELERIAETNGKRLDMQEIKDYFSDMVLTEEQFDFICKYYESKQIYIENRVERSPDEMIAEDMTVTTEDDPMDAEIVQMYRAEAAAMRKLTAEEEHALFLVAAEGDKGARNIILEGNLMLAIDVAESFAGLGMQMSDLIQEANLALMDAVNTYQGEAEEDLHTHKINCIRKHLEEALDEYNQSKKSGMKVAARINQLNDLATAYAKEHDKEASPEELAIMMGITEEEVRDLMKASLDAIGV